MNVQQLHRYAFGSSTMTSYMSDSMRDYIATRLLQKSHIHYIMHDNFETDGDQSRASVPKPIVKLGRRVVKYAEKKFNKPSNYPESNHHTPTSANYPPPLNPSSPYNVLPQYPNTYYNETVVPPQLPPVNLPQYPTVSSNVTVPFSSVQPHPYYHPPNTFASIHPQQPPPANPPPPPPPPPSAPSNVPLGGPQKPSYAPLLNCSGPIVTEDLLLQMNTRLYSATKALGSSAVTEARKGLSRVLTPTIEDIQLFGYQLKTCQVIAVEPNWNTLDDQLPCFAISYVQHPPTGRFKFSDQQWQNLHTIVAAIAQTGVTHFRLWLDQCLWLRDASQPSWVHSGILPYVLWPVIALGAKHPGGERTTDSFVRMWPFVEQISALWGMGLIIGSEYRSKDMHAGTRSWLSYNLRLRTEPERNLMIILLNIFHGATDGLQTGWVEDVRELREIAVANITHCTDDIIIGSNWQERFANIEPLSCSNILDRLKLPRHRKDYGDGKNVYLDGSRKLQSTGWQGVREWFSGNEGPVPPSEDDIRRAYRYDIGDKYNVVTDNGEYQLLQVGDSRKVVWLLVAMQGRTSYFSRGRVAWTKIVSGLSSCNLHDILGKENVAALQRVLREQVDNDGLRIISLREVRAEIEWI